MRLLGLALALCGALPAQYRLYTCMINSRDYVVGAKLPPSGLFFQSGDSWVHAGFDHPYISAVDYDPRDPATLYLSAGNGLIRASQGGRSGWKILTGDDVTELRDLAVDPNSPGTIYFAHTAGIRVTRDGGATWQPADSGIRRKYTESIRVDRMRSGRLVAGTEEGLFFSGDGGRSWRLAGAAGFQIMHIEQSPSEPCTWLAVTQQGGAFRSGDCGVTFENLGRIGVDRNLYDVAFDPATPGRFAVAGFGTGVALTEDGGKTWLLRNRGLPRPDVWSIAFDPGHPGRLYAGVHEDALYVSDDAGWHWRKDGLDGSVIFRMRFITRESGR